LHQSPIKNLPELIQVRTILQPTLTRNTAINDAYL
jgi:hypothetical protein